MASCCRLSLRTQLGTSVSEMEHGGTSVHVRGISDGSDQPPVNQASQSLSFPVEISIAEATSQLIQRRE